MRKVVLATHSFELVPLTDALYEELNGGATEPVASGIFEYLSARVEEWVASASLGGRLAYVEAEYFGGTGLQAAVGFQEGAIALGPMQADVGPINTALNFLGVVRTAQMDEFDTVDLGRHRSVDDWV
jgi:hypothetical protein